MEHSKTESPRWEFCNGTPLTWLEVITHKWDWYIDKLTSYTRVLGWMSVIYTPTLKLESPTPAWLSDPLERVQGDLEGCLSRWNSVPQIHDIVHLHVHYIQAITELLLSYMSKVLILEPRVYVHTWFCADLQVDMYKLHFSLVGPILIPEVFPSYSFT